MLGSALLVRAGFLRQAYSGIFHLLPLGLRVQDKLEALVDKHMKSVGASKLSLSTISSQSIWQRSGRYDKAKAQLFGFEDRRRSKYLLSPTHEEEITSLVGGMVQSPKDLPLRLYQIGRKYRDEPRARGGLLRSREFLMKDLYTFDRTAEEALVAYEEIKRAYYALFADLKLPVLVAAADSGDMGGNLSHEFHLQSNLGEDTIISCNTCDYVANEEVALPSKLVDTRASVGKEATSTWVGVSTDRQTLVVAHYPTTNRTSAASEINTHAVKRVFPDLDTSVEKPTDLWLASLDRTVEQEGSRKNHKIMRVFDYRVNMDDFIEDKLSIASADVAKTPVESVWRADGQPLDLVRFSTGSHCPKCSSGTVEVNKAVEIGHVFYLGTRYSKVFRAVTDEKPASGAVSTSPKKVPLEMGCHGIGISRIIGTVADQLCDSKGLNWPKAIAPFEAVVIPGKGSERDAEKVYDTLLEGDSLSIGLQVDAVIDDRPRELVWKMKDADLLGIPVIIVLGRSWQKEQTCEVQCRRSGKPPQFVPLSKLRETVAALFSEL